MSLMSKDALLGASDLVTREVELPTIGGTVKVQSLPAAYSNQAVSEAMEVVTGPRGQQSARVNTAKLEELQVLHGLVEPKLSSLDEVKVFATKCGPAWRKVVDTIDEISGVDKATIEETNARFRAGGPGEAGDDVDVRDGSRDNGSDLPLRAGA